MNILQKTAHRETTSRTKQRELEKRRNYVDSLLGMAEAMPLRSSGEPQVRLRLNLVTA